MAQVKVLPGKWEMMKHFLSYRLFDPKQFIPGDKPGGFRYTMLRYPIFAVWGSLLGSKPRETGKYPRLLQALRFPIKAKEKYQVAIPAGDGWTKESATKFLKKHPKLSGMKQKENPPVRFTALQGVVSLALGFAPTFGVRYASRQMAYKAKIFGSPISDGMKKGIEYGSSTATALAVFLIVKDFFSVPGKLVLLLSSVAAIAIPEKYITTQEQAKAKEEDEKDAIQRVQEAAAATGASIYSAVPGVNMAVNLATNGGTPSMQAINTGGEQSQAYDIALQSGKSAMGAALPMGGTIWDTYVKPMLQEQWQSYTDPQLQKTTGVAVTQSQWDQIKNMAVVDPQYSNLYDYLAARNYSDSGLFSLFPKGAILNYNRSTFAAYMKQIKKTYQQLYDYFGTKLNVSTGVFFEILQGVRK
jgi:hypothetical protein